MNISALLTGATTGLSASTSKSANAGTTAATPSSSAVLAAAQPLAQVDKRLQADVDTTTAKLSKFGLMKSAVAGSQGAARTLSALPPVASAAEVTEAMGQFFNAFNSAVSASKAAATAPGSAVASQSANRVSADLKKSLSTDPAVQDAMKKLGLVLLKDGTLGHDVKKFAAALTSDPVGTRAALAKLGKKVDGVTTQELASSGTVDTGMSSLVQRQTTLAAQQKAMKALAASMATSTMTNTTGGALAAYRRNS